MKAESFEMMKELDRLATQDEVRTALALCEDFEACQATSCDSIEIPSDCGGYVRIATAELDFLSLIEEPSSQTE